MYRWMCSRIVAGSKPHLFGFVTSGRNHPGATGKLCEVREYNANPDGTFDTSIVSTQSFRIMETWSEEVPPEEVPGYSGSQRRVPPLLMGYC